MSSGSCSSRTRNGHLHGRYHEIIENAGIPYTKISDMKKLQQLSAQIYSILFQSCETQEMKMKSNQKYGSRSGPQLQEGHGNGGSADMSPVRHFIYLARIQTIKTAHPDRIRLCHLSLAFVVYKPRNAAAVTR